MAAGHSHDEPSAEPLRAGRIRRILLFITVPLAVLTAIGIGLLWPQDAPINSRAYYTTGATMATVEVVSVDGAGCGVEVPADPTPGSGQQMCVEVTEGIDVGQTVPMVVPAQFLEAVEDGTALQAVRHEQQDSGDVRFVFVDIERTTPMFWLLGIYVLLVLAVARWRGLGAILGLSASVGTLIVWVIPALMSGQPPMLVTLVGVSAMLFFSVYLAHGISIRTTTALLGTFGGVALAIVIAMWQVRSTGLSTSGDEAEATILTMLPDVSLQSLLVCGIVIAGLGALNDVTITQASAVWELHATDPSMTRTQLFRRAMRIGADHIASTVYTLAFAYAGTALATLVVLMTLDRGPLETLMSSELASEIVRTVVASIGLIVAIPVTTLLATVLVMPRKSNDVDEQPRGARLPSAFDDDF